jgi:hypothetical protein
MYYVHHIQCCAIGAPAHEEAAGEAQHSQPLERPSRPLRPPPGGWPSAISSVAVAAAGWVAVAGAAGDGWCVVIHVSAISEQDAIHLNYIIPQLPGG